MMEPHVDFDFNSLDPELQGDAQNLAYAAFRRVLQFCWRGRGSQKEFRVALRRFVVLSAAYDRRLVSDANYTELAHALGCTKAAVSSILSDFCEEFDVHAHQRTDESRNNMRHARVLAAREQRKAKENESV